MIFFLYCALLRLSFALALGDPNFIPGIPPDPKMADPVDQVIDTNEATDQAQPQLDQELRQSQQDLDHPLDENEQKEDL